GSGTGVEVGGPAGRHSRTGITDGTHGGVEGSGRGGRVGGTRAAGGQRRVDLRGHAGTVRRPPEGADHRAETRELEGGRQVHRLVGQARVRLGRAAGGQEGEGPVVQRRLLDPRGGQRAARGQVQPAAAQERQGRVVVAVAGEVDDGVFAQGLLHRVHRRLLVDQEVGAGDGGEDGLRLPARLRQRRQSPGLLDGHHEGTRVCGAGRPVRAVPQRAGEGREGRRVGGGHPVHDGGRRLRGAGRPRAG